MVNVSSTIKLNLSALKTLDTAQINALAQAADAGLTETVKKQVMPFDKGEMQNSETHIDDSQKQRGKVAIVTTAPQARRLYYHPEYNFQKGKNPNAGARWFDWMTDAKFLTNAFRAAMKRLGGL